MGSTGSGKEEQASKGARLEARVTEAQKALLLRAAHLTGRSLSEFVVTSAQEAARRTVREHETMKLSLRDQKAFVAALLEPPAPGRRLRQAAKRYRRRSATDAE